MMIRWGRIIIEGGVAATLGLGLATVVALATNPPLGNPLFMEAANFDARLQENSPARDAGTAAFGVADADLDGNFRLSGSIDIQQKTLLDPPPGYKLFFSDEFDYIGPPDPSKWGVESHNTADPSMVTVDGSKMILRATGTQESDRVSGGVRSSDTLHLSSWKGALGLTRMLPAPGWLEIGMRPSQVRGVMSEIVLWTTYHEWPLGTGDLQLGELDLVEARGFQPTVFDFDTHAWTHPTTPPNIDRAGPHSTLVVTPDQSHQFVAHFDRDFVHFYVDGVLAHRRVMASDPFPIFGYPVSITMNCFIASHSDTGWAGAQGIDYPVDTRMEVDYVRFYTKGGALP